MAHAILLIECPDQKGIVTAVTEFIYTNGGNIIELDQYIDPDQGHFFMRVSWDTDEFNIPREKIGEYFDTLLAQQFEIHWNLNFSDNTPRMAIFVSKLSHCLYDILSRWQSAEWQVEIPLIVSNHADLKPIADRHNIPFVHIPITKENKKDQEKTQLQILKKHKIDFVVLARYMQIISEDFISEYEHKIINIHHSFLPAFVGAKPYHAAYERGVKIIGATSHYVTKDLDAGPIIEQDVTRVRHHNTIPDLVKKGKDLEKLVLSKAISYHIDRKTLVVGNKTIVFN